MKYSFYIFLCIATGLSQAQSASFSGNFKGLQIKSCLEGAKKCFKIVSPEATMSQFVPLYTFKKFDLEIMSEGETKKITGEFGYLDLAQRQIVVHSDITNAEYSISLDSLVEKDFSK